MYHRIHLLHFEDNMINANYLIVKLNFVQLALDADCRLKVCVFSSYSLFLHSSNQYA